MLHDILHRIHQEEVIHSLHNAGQALQPLSLIHISLRYLDETLAQLGAVASALKVTSTSGLAQRAEQMACLLYTSRCV